MNQKGFGTLLFFIITFTSSITAQQPLTLEQCRRLAIENNKALKIATEQERIAYYEKKDALTKFFPDISFAGGYLHNQKNLYLISSGVIPTSITLPIEVPGIGNTIPIDESVRNSIHDLGKVDIKNIWAGGFTLTQPVFMGGKIVAYNDLRSYAQELAKTMKETQMTDVIVETDNAYWQVVSVANKKKLAEAYVGLMQKMDSDISAMEEEGVATKADRLSVNVKLNEAEMTLTKAENGLSLAKMLLSQICGLDISDKITLQDENITSIPTSEDADIIPNVDEAIANRTEIRSLDLATKIYGKKEKIALAEFMPNVALTANYIWTNPNLFDGMEKKFAGMWNVGVVMKIPLNFASNSAKLNAAKAETRIKQFEMEDAKEKIKLQINQSAYKLTEANKKLIAAKKNTEKADENLRYANVGFEEGVIPSSDVIAAHTAWLSAHAELIDAQIDIILCRIYLNKALGRKI
ncbi:TolC family protein [Dysgonomonas sp. 521]|uniref:TolC family protein n=1 Tax=Dysgonomonas sp. 521 TaxID=2302932 RepID=UPI0013D5CE25|nr:TolC family protein [Dysgonomonas sp. 521]NDV94719.1 TolC family protein [Dysgonomonas sp. 521]